MTKKAEIGAQGAKLFTEVEISKAFDVLCFILVGHAEATKCKGPDACEVAGNLHGAMRAILAFAELCYPGSGGRFADESRKEAEKATGVSLPKPGEPGSDTARMIDRLSISDERKEFLRKLLGKAGSAPASATEPATPPAPHIVPPTKTVH